MAKTQNVQQVTHCHHTRHSCPRARSGLRASEPTLYVFFDFETFEFAKPSYAGGEAYVRGIVRYAMFASA